MKKSSYWNFALAGFALGAFVTLVFMACRMTDNYKSYTLSCQQACGTDLAKVVLTSGYDFDFCECFSRRVVKLTEAPQQ